MVAQFVDSPSLYPDIIERATPPAKGEHAYYRRRSDGKIGTAPAWPSFKADMEFKGWDYLAKYGVFTHGTPQGNTNKDRTGRDFNAILEPWRLIFQAGGAEEFPVWQIIAMRWHLRPPYREVEFPQMKGVGVSDFFCPECETGIFSATEEQEALEQLRIHLTSRTNDSHSYRPEDLRALGQELGIDFFAPRRRRGQRPAAPSTEMELEPVVLDLSTINTSVICPECGQSFAHNGALTGHRRTHLQAGGLPAPDSEGVGL